jgi:hypothetical protein
MIRFVSIFDFYRSSECLSLLDPVAIKKLGDDHNALKNGDAIHGLSLFPVEEMESCIKRENCRQIIKTKGGTAYRGCGRPSASGPLSSPRKLIRLPSVNSAESGSRSIIIAGFFSPR